MTQFGDFANLNVDRLVDDARQRFARVHELQERTSAFEGHARTEDGRISATYTATGGLTGLHLDPRALRMGSEELAEKIVEVIGEAARDLQRQNAEAMNEVFGEDGNPMRYLTDQQAVEDRATEMRQSFDRTMNDVVGELDRVRRRLGI
ncbi:MAG TPA: YbaB/EbfC family nucleoid-associated protein [Mycobacteriales bacterium]|nr:YbaB/EbfC family nucleoid-associated protein [Mycobacteriales bacterium]